MSDKLTKREREFVEYRRERSFCISETTMEQERDKSWLKIIDRFAPKPKKVKP